MSAFVHEMNGLLGMASATEASIDAIRKKPGLDRATHRELSRVYESVSELRRKPWSVRRLTSPISLHPMRGVGVLAKNWLTVLTRRCVSFTTSRGEAARW